jgi:hypothetical protein
MPTPDRRLEIMKTLLLVINAVLLAAILQKLSAIPSIGDVRAAKGGSRKELLMRAPLVYVAGGGSSE